MVRNVDVVKVPGIVGVVRVVRVVEVVVAAEVPGVLVVFRISGTVRM